MGLIFTIILVCGFIYLIGDSMLTSYVENKSDKSHQSFITKYREQPRYIIDDFYVAKKTILIFEKSRVLVIFWQECKFSDITDVLFNGVSTYHIKTSTTGAIGRGLVGGLALGGVGAIAGARTASKKAKSEDEYVVSIVTNSLSAPIIEYKTQNLHAANELLAVVKIILDRNKNRCIKARRSKSLKS